MIYITNATDSLNSSLRKAVRLRGHFPHRRGRCQAAPLGLARSEPRLEGAIAGVEHRQNPVRGHGRRQVHRNLIRSTTRPLT